MFWFVFRTCFSTFFQPELSFRPREDAESDCSRNLGISSHPWFGWNSWELQTQTSTETTWSFHRSSQNCCAVTVNTTPAAQNKSHRAFPIDFTVGKHHGEINEPQVSTLSNLQQRSTHRLSLQPDIHVIYGHDRKCYLHCGEGLPVLLTGSSRKTTVWRTLTAVPEPEAPLGDTHTQFELLIMLCHIFHAVHVIIATSCFRCCRCCYRCVMSWHNWTENWWKQLAVTRHYMCQKVSAVLISADCLWLMSIRSDRKKKTGAAHLFGLLHDLQERSVHWNHRNKHGCGP